jgi:hypothetical protein
MSETLTENRSAMSQPFFGTAQLSLNVLDVKTTNILEFDPLEQVPNTFLRIQLRRISRQLFEMNALGTSFAQEVFDGLTAMNRSSVPDHQQVSGDLTGQQLQEANHIGALVRMILHLHKRPAFWSNTAHRREVITGQLESEHRRLTHGSIGVDGHGKQIKSRLIYKDDGPLFLLGFFFNAGQRCSFQAAIAASSRCVALWMGFCRLYLMRRRRRLA